VLSLLSAEDAVEPYPLPLMVTLTMVGVKESSAVPVIEKVFIEHSLVSVKAGIEIRRIRRIV
jgi:hypothetical protein